MSMEDDSNPSNLNTAESKKQRKAYVPRSNVWNHFTKYLDEDGKQRSQCKHCSVNYAYSSKNSGTSNMRGHILVCKGNPANSSTNQSNLAFSVDVDEETGDNKVNLQTFKFDQKKGRRAIAEMLISDELPFKFVGGNARFDGFMEDDYGFYRYLQEGFGVPDSTDWGNARRLGGFLQHFYELTVRVSGTKYITSNTYLDSISFIDTVLKQCALSKDDELANMALSMTLKFDKYWGDITKFNLLVFIASLFDPRTKLAYLKVNLRSMYGNETGDKVCQLCENALLEIFNDYKRIHSDMHANKTSSSSSKTVNDDTLSCKSFSLFGSGDDTFRALRERKMAEVKRQKAELGVTEDLKTELDRYLKEEIEGDDVWFESQDFSVLGWWRKRSPAFPILSLIARDILAIPISTVASESTFSTGGRVFDTFRSSLTTQAVEALICCQDWIRPKGVACSVEESIEELDKLEEDMRRMPME